LKHLSIKKKLLVYVEFVIKMHELVFKSENWHNYKVIFCNSQTWLAGQAGCDVSSSPRP